MNWRLWYLRNIKYKLTKGYMCIRFSLQQQKYSKMENGKIEPTSNLLLEIRKLNDSDIEDFFQKTIQGLSTRYTVQKLNLMEQAEILEMKKDYFAGYIKVNNTNYFNLTKTFTGSEESKFDYFKRKLEELEATNEIFRLQEMD